MAACNSLGVVVGTLLHGTEGWHELRIISFWILLQASCTLRSLELPSCRFGPIRNMFVGCASTPIVAKMSRTSLNSLWTFSTGSRLCSASPLITMHLRQDTSSIAASTPFTDSSLGGFRDSGLRFHWKGVGQSQLSCLFLAGNRIFYVFFSCLFVAGS